MIPTTLQERIESVLVHYRGKTAFEIAQEHEIKVHFINDPDRDFSGAIQKIENNVHIYVNANNTPEHQLFTLAHELGHFFLHNVEVDTGIVSYRHAEIYRGYDEKQREREQQANHFAAELLMPKALFIKAYNEFALKLSGKELENKMAELFGVSGDAARVRMSYLDIVL